MVVVYVFSLKHVDTEATGFVPPEPLTAAASGVTVYSSRALSESINTCEEVCFCN